MRPVTGFLPDSLGTWLEDALVAKNCRPRTSLPSHGDEPHHEFQRWRMKRDIFSRSSNSASRYTSQRRCRYAIHATASARTPSEIAVETRHMHLALSSYVHHLAAASFHHRSLPPRPSAVHRRHPGSLARGPSYPVLLHDPVKRLALDRPTSHSRPHIPLEAITVRHEIIRSILVQRVARIRLEE